AIVGARQIEAVPLEQFPRLLPLHVALYDLPADSNVAPFPPEPPHSLTHSAVVLLRSLPGAQVQDIPHGVAGDLAFEAAEVIVQGVVEWVVGRASTLGLCGRRP